MAVVKRAPATIPFRDGGMLSSFDVTSFKTSNKGNLMKLVGRVVLKYSTICFESTSAIACDKVMRRTKTRFVMGSVTLANSAPIIAPAAPCDAAAITLARNLF